MPTDPKPADLVFVLGAGAAVDYQFPLGRALLLALHPLAQNKNYQNTIADLVAPDAGDSLTDARAYVAALAAHALQSGVGSIDRFLMERRELAPYGKVLIAYRLLKYERDSKIGIEEKYRWYEYLWDTIYKRFKAGSLSIAFVTLNYDRSLEQFLRTAVAGLWGVERADDAIRERLPILHLHGDLGRLASTPWGGREDGSWSEAASAAKGISLLGEKDSEERYARAVRMLVQAKQICFLGLGYHDEIMLPLVPAEVWSHNNPTRPTVYACTYGLPPAARSKALNHLSRIPGPSQPQPHDGDCLSTLQRFGVLDV
jgi:hypothetical protein